MEKVHATNQRAISPISYSLSTGKLPIDPIQSLHHKLQSLTDGRKQISFEKSLYTEQLSYGNIVLLIACILDGSQAFSFTTQLMNAFQLILSHCASDFTNLSLLIDCSVVSHNSDQNQNSYLGKQLLGEKRFFWVGVAAIDLAIATLYLYTLHQSYTTNCSIQN